VSGSSEACQIRQHRFSLRGERICEASAIAMEFPVAASFSHLAPLIVVVLPGRPQVFVGSSLSGLTVRCAAIAVGNRGVT